MTKIDEIASDLFRLSIYIPELDMQFNHFLVRDEQPLLFHAGFKRMFPELREAVAKVIHPSELRYIGWSHFESDEIGALNEWLGVAPLAQPVCGLVGKLVSVDDFSVRPARGMTSEEVLVTGKYRFRFHATPHLPHGWDAGVLFEETQGTLFCSDLFHHFGDVAPLTSSDLIDPARRAFRRMQQGPLADYIPYTRDTANTLYRLADLNPSTLAVMHGSSYRGDGGKLLIELSQVIQGDLPS
ncbi:MAG: MBL fold metallo-hydrolase [Pirellulales bacterium]